MFNFFGDGGFPGQQEPEEPADTDAFYNTLGVNKEASQNDIKKAYRKKAMRHHPDKGGDAELFKGITRAYEVLSDPKKREVYDKYGEKGLERGGDGGGMDPSDIFSFFGGGGGGGRRGPRKGKDVLFRLKVSLEDLYNGANKKLRLTKQVICKGCSGKGGKGVMKCPACKGRGVRVIIRQIGPGMIQQMQAQCDDCKGEGEIIPPGQRCGECRGEKTVKVKKTLEVHVDKGMRDGQKVVFRGESDESPGIQPGDVVVVLEQAEHEHFVRKSQHLFYKKKITLLQSLTGFTHYIEHLDGRVLRIESDENTVYEPNCVKCIRDEGMYSGTNQFLRGNLYIEYEVVFPDMPLTGNAKKQLMKFLPNGKQETTDVEEDEIETVILSNVDMNIERQRWQEEARGRGEAYDEDESGGQQTSCRAQ